MSESFPDEGDKVEVISRALMQYDSRSNRWYTVKSRREKKNISPLKEATRFAQATFGRKVDLRTSESWWEENQIPGLFCQKSLKS